MAPLDPPINPLFLRFMIYLDDMANTLPLTLQRVQSEVLRLQELGQPLLRYFIANLADMYKFWDLIPSNCINCAAFEFVNGCALENHPDFLNPEADSRVLTKSWAYYLRAKTGVAPAYAFMIFPKSGHSNLSYYLPAIPDICLFIDLTNDVLS
jgi:hypothetical protein